MFYIDYLWQRVTFSILLADLTEILNHLYLLEKNSKIDKTCSESSNWDIFKPITISTILNNAKPRDVLQKLRQSSTLASKPVC